MRQLLYGTGVHLLLYTSSTHTPEQTDQFSSKRNDVQLIESYVEQGQETIEQFEKHSLHCQRWIPIVFSSKNVNNNYVYTTYYTFFIRNLAKTLNFDVKNGSKMLEFLQDLFVIRFSYFNRCSRGFGKCNAFWSIDHYLGIWTYFETNYPHGNIHYVEIPSLERSSRMHCIY